MAFKLLEEENVPALRLGGESFEAHGALHDAEPPNSSIFGLAGTETALPDCLL